MIPQAAYPIEIGAGLTVHIPRGGKLTRYDTNQIEVAMAACIDGFVDISRKTVVAFETRHGLTDYDREAAAVVRSGGEVVGAFVPLRDADQKLDRLRGRILDRAAKAPVEEPRKATDDEVFMAEQLRRLEDIDSALEREDAKRRETVGIVSDRKRRKVRRLIAERRVNLLDSRARVLEALNDREEARWMADRQAELAELEALRGGEVVTERVRVVTPVIEDGFLVWDRGVQVVKHEERDRQRISGHDGMFTLAASLTDNQHAAGMRYREVYAQVARAHSLGAMDPESLGLPRSPFDYSGAGAYLRISSHVQAQKTLERLDRAIHDAAGAEGVEIVQAVAGQGLTVRSIAPSGRRNIRLTKALLVGLDALADHFGLQ